MSKGKKILLGIVIIVIGIFTLQIVNYQTASDEQKEQWAAESEEEDREKRGLLLKTARDIEPSKLSESWGQYKINAGNILSKYVLEYQGKDRSGKSLVSQLNDLNDEFNWCDKNVKWEVEIASWTDELILLDVETEFMKCTSPIQLEFVYDSQIDHLRHNNNDLNPDFEKAIINYLDNNP